MPFEEVLHLGAEMPARSFVADKVEEQYLARLATGKIHMLSVLLRRESNQYFRRYTNLRDSMAGFAGMIWTAVLVAIGVKSALEKSTFRSVLIGFNPAGER